MTRRPAMLLSLAALLFVLAGFAGEIRAGSLFGWDPFRVKGELAPGDAVWKNVEPLPLERGARNGQTGGKEAAPGTARVADRSRYAVRIGYWQLYLSRFPSADHQKGLAPPAADRGGVLDALRSLPVEMQADPTRAAQSIGRIFEPQLNLGIEF
jgi:hypothetical protein